MRLQNYFLQAHHVGATVIVTKQIIFMECIDAENKKLLESDFNDPETEVTVQPIFVQTG
jgi:hypothetical protein